MSGLFVAIDPYIARLSSGVNVGYFGPINTTTLKITQPDPDKIERVSYLRASYGQALDSYSRPKPAEIEFTFDDIDPDLLSWALLGTPAAYTQTAQTDTAGSFTARHDRWVALPYNSLTEFVVSGKTVDVDYQIEMEAGLVKVLSTGSIVNAATVSYTLDAAARTGKTIDAGTDTVLQLAIRGVAENLFVDGQRWDLDVWQANVSPSGALDFVSKEPISLTFKGTLIVPAGKAGPYQLRQHVAG
jgi:hypothetical protein